MKTLNAAITTSFSGLDEENKNDPSVLLQIVDEEENCYDCDFNLLVRSDALKLKALMQMLNACKFDHLRNRPLRIIIRRDLIDNTDRLLAIGHHIKKDNYVYLDNDSETLYSATEIYQMGNDA